MKKSSCRKSRYGYLCTIMLALITLCFTACKDDSGQEEGAFDPSKPLQITDFSPKEGGFGSNLILYGDNFGNDPAKLKVTVGGKQANIISVKNKSLFCVIPQKAYDGDIQVSVRDDNGDEIAYAEAEETFTYVKKWLVTTYIGQHYENANDAVEKEGAFDDCGYIKKPFWLSFDPKSNFDHLYLTTHDGGYCRLFNLKEETVSFLNQFSKNDRPAIINWTVDEKKDMIVSRDLDPAGDVNVLYSRASNFKEATVLTEKNNKKYKAITGAMIHPENGELYFTTYNEQEIYRYNMETKEVTTSSKHLRTKETTRLVAHPSGKFAYMMRSYCSNGNGYIARMDYDYNAKRFSEPYIFVGTEASGYADGVGNSARLNGPGQGVFVKNPDYEGEEDEYDFYFCDEKNNCIRVLTPTGRVTTFAGRGNGIAAGGYADGELRTEARFNAPLSIAYDEKRQCFYVGDSDGNGTNSKGYIRKIALEE